MTPRSARTGAEGRACSPGLALTAAEEGRDTSTDLLSAPVPTREGPPVPKPVAEKAVRGGDGRAVTPVCPPHCARRRHRAHASRPAREGISNGRAGRRRICAGSPRRRIRTWTTTTSPMSWRHSVPTTTGPGTADDPQNDTGRPACRHPARRAGVRAGSVDARRSSGRSWPALTGSILCGRASIRRSASAASLIRLVNAGRFDMTGRRRPVLDGGPGTSRAPAVVLRYAGVWTGGPDAHLLTLAVSPSVRRSGIGTALVSAARAMAGRLPADAPGSAGRQPRRHPPVRAPRFRAHRL